MQIVVDSAEEFKAEWSGERNFLIAPSCFHFTMGFPPVEEVVDILRRDEEVKIFPKEEMDEAAQQDFVRRFCTRPLEEVMEYPFGLIFFELNRFYKPGQFLCDLQKRIMIPWRTFLSSQGFTWQRCAPYIFISGRGCSSDYHTDFSHVMAWQLSGVKVFNGFKNPDHYAPIDLHVRRENAVRYRHPPAYNPSDLLPYRMEPGDLLWNQLLTPHWVVAGDESAMSLNISHGGLRLLGQFCPREAALRRWWDEHPEEVWMADLRY